MALTPPAILYVVLDQKQSEMRKTILTLTLSGLLFASVNILALTPREVYQKVKDSIYTVYVTHDLKNAYARGSAVAISDSILATNCHVALQGGYVVVKDKGQTYNSKIIYQNLDQDLCLLKVQVADLKPVAMRSATTADIGEEIYAIGNPNGDEKTLSRGIISNKDKEKNGTWLQTDAAINFGSSGGGLFDANGNLLGITTKMAGNFSFALPSDWIIALVHGGLEKAPLEQKSAEIYKPAYDNLTKIGTFGIDDINVYRNNAQCFILITGRDDNRTIRSLFLWNPAKPTSGIFFPTTADASQAMILIYQMALERQEKNPVSIKTNSTFALDDKTYPMTTLETDTGSYLFFMAGLPENFQQVLLNTKNFMASFKSQDPRVGYFDVNYGLRGFDYAYEVYKRDCGTAQQ